MLGRSWIGEGWRNFWSGATAALTTATLLAVGGSGLGLADASALDHAVHERQSFDESGASTWLLSAQGGIVGRSCDSLAGSGEILAAGAVRDLSPPPAFAAAPASAITFWQGTPGLAQVLGAPAHPGLLVSRDLAASSGLDRIATSRLVDGRYAMRVTAFANFGSADALQNLAIDIEPTAGRYDACWMRTTGGPNSAVLGRISLVPGPDAGNAQLTQLSSAQGTTSRAAPDYRTRPTRWAPAGALVIGVLVAVGAVRGRRLELAAARHLGQPRAAQALQAATEATLVALCVLAVDALAAAALARVAPAGAARDAALTTWRTGAAAAAGYLAAYVGATVLSVRERSLYNHFKQR